MLIYDIVHYTFLRNAILAGILSAIATSLIGYFLVLRQQNFAGHALSHMGFTGAAGASLLHLTPNIGQLLLTLGAAVGIGVLGEKINKTDTVIGIILAFMLGLGVLFLYFYTQYAGIAMRILFGDLFGVSNALLATMFAYTCFVILGIACIARPLLFISIDPELAEAKGINIKLISTLFLCILAIVITEASQIIGVLLVFTLLVAPAASALQCSRTVWGGIILSIFLSLGLVIVGILMAYITNWPSAFWMTFLSLAMYLTVRIFCD